MEMIKSNIVYQINPTGPVNGKTQVHIRYGPNMLISITEDDKLI